MSFTVAMLPPPRLLRQKGYSLQSRVLSNDARIARSARDCSVGSADGQGGQQNDPDGPERRRRARCRSRAGSIMSAQVVGLREKNDIFDRAVKKARRRTL